MKPWKLTKDFFQVSSFIPDGWGTFDNSAPLQSEIKPSFHDDEAKKRAFGIELAKQDDNKDGAFKAALNIFEDQIGSSLWISHNWINDPIVIASRDIYLKTLKSVEKPLDRIELAAKLLTLADEKIEKNGQKFYIHEAKDRITALKTYAEVLGYVGKVNIDNSTNNFNNNNRMELYLVKSDNKNEQKVIESNVEEDAAIDDLDVIPLEIKLVS